MATDFLTLVNNILLEIDENEVTSSELVDTATTNREMKRVKNWVNRVYRNVAYKNPDWSWLRLVQSFSTVAGQNNYSVGVALNSATDLEKLFLVQISGKPPMELITDLEFKRRYGDFETTAAAEPCVAYVSNSKLYLHPAPVQVYTVNVISSKVITALSAAADEPLIPETKRDVIHHGALMLAKNFENDIDQQVQAQLFQDALNALKASERNNHKGYAIIPEEETLMAEEIHQILYE